MSIEDDNSEELGEQMFIGLFKFGEDSMPTREQIEKSSGFLLVYDTPEEANKMMPGADVLVLQAYFDKTDDAPPPIH
jgi:hypothetical protein